MEQLLGMTLIPTQLLDVAHNIRGSRAQGVCGSIPANPTKRRGAGLEHDAAAITKPIPVNATNATVLMTLVACTATTDCLTGANSKYVPAPETLAFDNSCGTPTPIEFNFEPALV